MKAWKIVSIGLLCIFIFVLYGAKRNKEEQSANPTAVSDSTAIATEQSTTTLREDIERLKEQVSTMQDSINSLKQELISSTNSNVIEQIVKKELRNQPVQVTSAAVQSELKPQVNQLRIGLVDIRYLFQNCKENVRYQQKASVEQDKVVAQLEKLKSQFEASKADMNTRRIGSDDYVKLMQEMVEQQADFEAKKEFHQRRLQLEDQLWTEQLMQKIIDSVAAVAQQREMDLVLTKDQLNLEAPSANELMLAIRTHKLLYGRETLDITREVLAHLDSQE
ncbi:MAG: OmpH family outer membrane protein [Planctomycetota bacterium]